MNKSPILIGFLIIATFCLMQVACSNASDIQPLRIDSSAPDFKLIDLDGQKVSLRDFRGKIVLINFWATTCGPCVSEMPVLEEFSKSAASSGVVFLSINAGEDPNVVRDFILGNKYTFQVLLDSQYDVAGKYNVRYIPDSYFIDKEGLVKINLVGPFKNKEAIDKQLAGLIP